MKSEPSGKRPSGRSQLRTSTARLINLLLLLGFCILAGTGLMLVFRLPPGSRGGRGLEVFGFDRHQWGDFHFWISIAVFVLLAVHLLLHLAWLKKVAGHGRWRMVVAGVGLGVALIVVPLLLPVTGRDTAEIRPGVSAGSETIRVSNDPPVSFKHDVLPVFEMSCIDCHGPKKAKADFRIDDLEALFRQEKTGCLVLPGRPRQSRLIKIVSGKVRFKKATEDHILEEAEVEMLTKWIAQGAPVDN